MSLPLIPDRTCGGCVECCRVIPLDLPELAKLKFELLNKSGHLHYEYDTAKFADVAGASRLKRWIEQRRAVFVAGPAAGSSLRHNLPVDPLSDDWREAADAVARMVGEAAAGRPAGGADARAGGARPSGERASRVAC